MYYRESKVFAFFDTKTPRLSRHYQCLPPIGLNMNHVTVNTTYKVRSVGSDEIKNQVIKERSPKKGLDSLNPNGSIHTRRSVTNSLTLIAKDLKNRVCI